MWWSCDLRLYQWYSSTVFKLRKKAPALGAEIFSLYLSVHDLPSALRALTHTLTIQHCKRKQYGSHFLTSVGRLFSLKHEKVRSKLSRRGKEKKNLQTFIFKMAVKILIYLKMHNLPPIKSLPINTQSVQRKSWLCKSDFFKAHLNFHNLCIIQYF